ncbi:phospholipase A and acyltransferase 3-like isoform X2 [Sorex fumeus]|uniref:phospholipase A and acyltransferase 3-like isoform X2 n=1 Tax=Sorex fumeus TaxID=62283 RepID=UPI0024AD33BB|nr:phospholipase A and acyltransferase 3-like isoform X2 [Sorex fumeus]
MTSKRIGPQPKPGDLVEIFHGGRFTPAALRYQHWAVYVGDGYVVHLTQGDNEISSGKVFLAASVLGIQAVVKKELLLKVAEGCVYQVNNKLDGKRRVRSPEEIVQKALAQEGKESHYSLTRENCEHFVMELRYGEPMSDQGTLN